MTNYFNTFFTNIASKLSSKLKICPNLFGVSTTAFKTYYDQNVIENKFEIKEVIEEEILIELEKLKIDKSCGLDNLPSRFLKDGSTLLAKPITFITNLSISCNTFPDEFFPVLSKLLEKVVHKQLTEYLHTFNLIDNLLYILQSTFRGVPLGAGISYSRATRAVLQQTI